MPCRPLLLILFFCLPSLHPSPLLSAHTRGHERGFCYLLLSHPLCVNVYCRLKKNSSLWISVSLVMLYLLDLSRVPITSKSGRRDLCRLCSWHRFRAVSREPAGCFTLQINPTTGREGGARGDRCERGRRAGTWAPSRALRRLVIYHKLTTLVLMLLPSGDESFPSHSGYPSASDIDCCHIILYKAIMIHDCLKERLVWVVFSFFLFFFLPTKQCLKQQLDPFSARQWDVYWN